MPIILACLLLALSCTAEAGAPPDPGRPNAGSAGFGAESATKTLDFCARGKFLFFKGVCSVPGDTPYKDTISEKACNSVIETLGDGLSVLYPNAQMQAYDNLDPESLKERFMQSEVLGFFFVGAGDINGGFLTGESAEALYPEEGLCVSLYDVYGGFTSHSKYSPQLTAPKQFRKKMLAKTEFIRAPGQIQGTWVRFCKPKVNMVYPTRTFAGRMKNDALKLLKVMQDRKREHMLSVLGPICGACPQYVQAGHPLSQLCPPQSSVCSTKMINAANYKLISDNYCVAIHPELAPMAK